MKTIFCTIGLSLILLGAFYINLTNGTNRQSELINPIEAQSGEDSMSGSNTDSKEVYGYENAFYGDAFIDLQEYNIPNPFPDSTVEIDEEDSTIWYSFGSEQTYDFNQFPVFENVFNKINEISTEIQEKRP